MVIKPGGLDTSNIIDPTNCFLDFMKGSTISCGVKTLEHSYKCSPGDL